MNEITIKVLGSVAPYCKKDKNCPGFLIEYKNNKYLFDCGNGITRQLNFPNDLENLKIFITHLHHDHIGDISAIANAALVYQRLGYLNNKIDIYLPNMHTIKQYVHINGEIINYWWYDIVNYEPSVEFKYLKGLEKTCPINIIENDFFNYQNDDLEIIAQIVNHPITTYAYRMNTDIGSIVYSADTGTKNNLEEFAYKSDLFICESTFLKGQIRKENNHLYAHEAAAIAKLANVKKLLLTHFWPELDKELYVKEAKAIFENTEAAYEGKVLKIRK